MDVRSLIRDPERVKRALFQQGKAVLAKEPCKIMVPSRYAERGLVELGKDTYIVGIFPLIVEDKFYSNSSVCAMMRIDPTVTTRELVEETEYLVFHFDKGATVIGNTQLVRQETLVYDIFNEILSKGRVPWQMNYDDLGNIFASAKEFAGAKVGNSREVMEVLVSMLSRDPVNRNLQYRHTLKNQAQVAKVPPAFIPLRSIQYAATNTTSKLAGSYFSDGIVSALNNPAERTERIENILRR